jgi:rubrerythrin
MNIYEFAMKMEQDGEAFYREMAAQTSAEGVRRILNMLADDEVKHYTVVKQMRDQAVAPQMEDTAILSQAKNVFEQMQGQTLDTGSLVRGGPQVEVYREAQEIERKSRDFYQEKADEVSSATHRELMLRIAHEENRHYFLLDHMIEFVNRPQTWIEDAEFNHLEEY